MKSKYLKHAVTALLFCCFLLAGLWIFAPWETAGRYMMDKIRLNAAKNAMFISYANFETNGVIFPTYTIKSLDIDQGMAKFTLAEANIRVLPLSSLLSGGASCHISFRDGMGVLIPDNKLNLTEGGFKLSISRSAIVVANVGIAGDLEATGKLSIDRRNNRVTSSTLTLKVPENIDNALKNPMLGGKILGYLESLPNGEWRIKQNATPNS